MARGTVAPVLIVCPNGAGAGVGRGEEEIAPSGRVVVILAAPLAHGIAVGPEPTA